MTPHLLPVLLLPVLLAACARTPQNPLPDPPLSPAHAACRDEARNAPDVGQAARELNAMNLENQRRVEHEMRVAQTSAYRDCLRRNGLAGTGGVEAPRVP
ncbi:phosphoribosylamine--glycine ligase [Teichococcus vastitatis]|uniref:Phosphoribosylamine--glycine ligase n=1 Tax=Teichococcus vastitatis TaxID=2307076 RepID=A0ABS9WBQ2_9PROT|nr:phosphoribosylamine--glycine ligase [Pseudoroseomonas vastitatis]MCI0756736.1 phosphoribosylamine--glycine ligase [Pseudoroseomonas vastitatis]